MDKESEEKKESSISFHASGNHNINGIAFDKEEVVQFGFKIDPKAQVGFFTLEVEQEPLGVKVFEAFDKVFSRFVKNVKFGDSVVAYGKPSFGGYPVGIGLGRKTFIVTWSLAEENKEKVIQEIKKLVGLYD